MEITETEAPTLRRTTLKDGDHVYVIDTANISSSYEEAGPFGSFIGVVEAMLGDNEYPPFEVLVNLDGEWLNFTRSNFETAEEALACHAGLIDRINQGHIKDVRGNHFKPDHPVWDTEKVDRLLGTVPEHLH